MLEIINETKLANQEMIAASLWNMIEKDLAWYTENGLHQAMTQEYIRKVVNVVLGKDFPDMLVYVGGSHIAIHLNGSMTPRDVMITNRGNW